MKKFPRQLLVIIFLSFLLTPTFVKGDIITIPNPLICNDAPCLINAIVNIIFTFAVAIAPLMIIVAGFYFVTAAGNPNQINTAKQIILWTLIGLLVVLCAKGIIALFRNVFGI